MNFSWDPLEEEWQKRFNELTLFKKNHGHSSPSGKMNIGRWCQGQRSKYKKGILSKEKIDLLDSLNFSWDPLEEEWQKNFDELKIYKKENGNSSPPKRKSSLGRWCQGQRSKYKKGILSREKIDLLDSMNFSWDPLEEEWQKRFKELKLFKEHHGHATPPSKGHSLSTWIVGQRSSFKSGKLDKVRIDLLNSLNFVWDKFGEDWQGKYKELKQFKEKNGHMILPSNDSILGRWCSDQRENFKKNKLNKEKIDLLDDLNFVWDILEEEWLKRFNKLILFKKNHGHLNIPQSNTSLVRWCLSQRENFKKEKLSKNRIELLESIGFKLN